MGENKVFELDEQFKQDVYDFIIDKLKSYENQDETPLYVIGQISAAIDEIADETYNPKQATIMEYLSDTIHNK